MEAAAAAGFGVTALNCVGGGARSFLWNQIKADVLGIPVRPPAAASGAAMGDVMMAGVGVGVYRDFAAAKAAVFRVTREFIPNEANRRMYDDLYRVYLDLYPALKESYVNLGKAGA
jgi:xylulokinase